LEKGCKDLQAARSRKLIKEKMEVKQFWKMENNMLKWYGRVYAWVVTA